MSAVDQLGSFLEFFNQLLPDLLDRKVSSAVCHLTIHNLFQMFHEDEQHRSQH